MSNTSAKQRYTQLMEWLPTFKKTKKIESKSNNPKKDSRLNYYKSKGY